MNDDFRWSGLSYMVGKELFELICPAAAKYWNQLKFPSTSKWIKKAWVCSECLLFCGMECYSAIRSCLVTCGNVVGTGHHQGVNDITHMWNLDKLASWKLRVQQW